MRADCWSRRPGTTAMRRAGASATVDSQVPQAVATRAWQAQVRLHHRHRTLIDHGKRSTVANVAVARELCGFLWATMADEPMRKEELAA